MLRIIPLAVQPSDAKGEGEALKQLFRSLFMKSNVHIAFKLPQVRCNLQVGHLKQSLSHLKSS